MHIDITERKRAEHDLRASEEKFRLLAEASRAVVYISRGSRFLYVNRRLTEASGYSREELLNLDVSQLLHPDYRELVLDGGQRRLSGEETPRVYECQFVTKTGHPRWFEIAPARIEYQGEPAMAGTGYDITDRKRVADELRRAKEAAEEANRAKDRFLAVLSHELRTPLTPALGLVTLLQGRAEPGADWQESLEIIRRNIVLEARLIDDLLDLTSIAGGKVELGRRPVRLDVILKRAVEVCGPDIEERGQHFSSDVASEPLFVNGDAGRLEQVFWNLLRNAIKFTPKRRPHRPALPARG